MYAPLSSSPHEVSTLLLVHLRGSLDCVAARTTFTRPLSPQSAPTPRFCCRHLTYCRSMGTLEKGALHPTCATSSPGSKGNSSHALIFPSFSIKMTSSLTNISVIWCYNKKYIYILVSVPSSWPELLKPFIISCDKGARCIFCSNS